MSLKFTTALVGFACALTLPAFAATPGPLTIATSIQSAEGVTPEMMDKNFLANLESYIVERMKLHTTRAKNLPAETKVIIDTAGSYVESDGVKFAVIRASSPEPFSSVMILGIVGDKARRVLCMRKGTTEPIPFTYGECGEKVKEFIVHENDKFQAQKAVDKTTDYYFGSERTPAKVPLREIDRLWGIISDTEPHFMRNQKTP